MPTSVKVGLLVLGAVLLLVFLTGGRFKIFGAEISDQIPRGFRFLAGILSPIFLLVAMAPADGNHEPGDGGAPDPPTGAVITPPSAVPSASPPAPPPQPPERKQTIEMWQENATGSPNSPGLYLGPVSILARNVDKDLYRIQIPKEYPSGKHYPQLACDEIRFDVEGNPDLLTTCTYFDKNQTATPIGSITMQCTQETNYVECVGTYVADDHNRVVLRR
jgi:hypothetical protein